MNNLPVFQYEIVLGRRRRVIRIDGMDQAHANSRIIEKYGGYPVIRRADTKEVIWRRKPEGKRRTPIAPKEIAMSRFTKLDAKGKDLPAAAAGHVAVRDNTTGLTWQAGDSEKRLTHKQAEAYAKKLKLLGGKGWRLPTVEELFLLADRTKTDPAIDKTFFPTYKLSWYWTGTLYAASPADFAWSVSFYGGYSFWCNRDNSYVARAVRPGQ